MSQPVRNGKRRLHLIILQMNNFNIKWKIVTHSMSWYLSYGWVITFFFFLKQVPDGVPSVRNRWTDEKIVGIKLGSIRYCFLSDVMSLASDINADNIRLYEMQKWMSDICFASDMNKGNIWPGISSDKCRIVVLTFRNQ